MRRLIKAHLVNRSNRTGSHRLGEPWSRPSPAKPLAGHMGTWRTKRPPCVGSKMNCVRVWTYMGKPNLGRMAAIQTLSVLLVNSQHLAWQSRVPIQTRPKRWASRQRSPAMTDRDRSVIVPGQQTKQGRTQRCCSRK